MSVNYLTCFTYCIFSVSIVSFGLANGLWVFLCLPLSLSSLSSRLSIVRICTEYNQLIKINSIRNNNPGRMHSCREYTERTKAMVAKTSTTATARAGRLDWSDGRSNDGWRGSVWVGGQGMCKVYIRNVPEARRSRKVLRWSVAPALHNLTAQLLYC